MASLPVHGRPRTRDAVKRISLRTSTFVLWAERKESLGIRGLSNSEFAEILLHQSSMDELRERCSRVRSGQYSKTRAAEGEPKNMFIYYLLML